MSLIADLAWIKRGIPKAVPDKVKLSSEEIRTLIQGYDYQTFTNCSFLNLHSFDDYFAFS